MINGLKSNLFPILFFLFIFALSLRLTDLREKALFSAMIIIENVAVSGNFTKSEKWRYLLIATIRTT